MNHFFHNITRFSVLPALCFLLAMPLSANAETYENGVPLFQKKIRKILANSCLRKKNYGIKIYSLDRGEALFELREKKLFVPASNLKILTPQLLLKHSAPTTVFLHGSTRMEN